MTGGQNGAVIPAGINTNETLYIVRHADAHPTVCWDDDNYVGCRAMARAGSSQRTARQRSS